jgi:hypothetical protein
MRKTEDRTQVEDKSGDRRYFTMIPNMLWEIGLTYHDREMYAFLKRIAGDHGTCWRSMRTLARESGLSLGQIEKSREILEAAGLITCDKRKRPEGGWSTWHISIVDVWKRNLEIMLAKRSQYEQIGDESVHTANESVHPTDTMGEKCTQDEQKCSQDARKEEPLRRTRVGQENLKLQEEASQQIFEPASPSFLEAATHAYENVIGFIAGAHQSQEIGDMVAELESRDVRLWWDIALQIAADQNKRSWAYVRAILVNCLREGKPPVNRNSQKPSAPMTRKRVDIIDPETGKPLNVEATS